MTDTHRAEADPSRDEEPAATGLARAYESKLSRLILQSRLALFWEAFWPLFVPVLVVSGLYVGLSWTGLWLFLPVWLRVIALALFAAVFIRTLLPLRKVRWPSRDRALHRVETESGVRHRPVKAVEDELAGGRGDAQSQALWEAHRRRMAATLKSLKAGWPRPGAFRADPYGLRTLAGMLLVVGFVSSGEDRWSRLFDLFPAEADAAGIATRIDAWVTPPVYTERPPIFLTGATAELRDPLSAIRIPEGSELVIRSQGSDAVSVSFIGGEGEAQPIEPLQAADIIDPTQPVDRRSVIEEDGRIVVSEGGTPVLEWAFSVEPDREPEIRLLDDPEEQFSGSLKFTYRVKDDYGVVSAAARIRPVARPERGNSENPRPLAEAPEFPLSLPTGDRRSGTGETFQDLTSHPWAGSEVELVMSVRDQAGQEGYSEPYRFTLPQRRFAKPLARAIVEQRRELALDANSQLRAIDAFDALLIAPDRFFEEPKHYLGTRFAYRELVKAETDEDLKEVLDLLWDVAVTIEDGDLSVAERRLRDAQEALRRALEEGASDEEIARLTEELRQAMNDYFQSLAQQLRQNPNALQQFDQDLQSLRPQDLDEMLDRIEELARSGSRDAARELLSQMQRMMENLQAGRQQNMPQGMNQEMMEALNELGRIIQRQQELMDQTHRFDQNQQGQQGQQGQRGQQGQQGQQGEGNRPMTPEELAEALRQLQQGQGDLAEQLQQLMESLQQNGMQPNEQLGQAGESMGNAGEELGRGETGNAVGEQGNALEALRQGAQGMMEQMMGDQGQGPGRGLARGRSPLDEDPLGRPRRTEGPDFGDRVRVPDEIDVQRARRILEELRRRFSDPSRPPFELDYLERLLERQ